MSNNMSSDPLQNELVRLRLQSHLNAKIHQEIKSKLRSDCKKEIDILVAQVRMKYEMQIEETEKEYVRKKKELEKHREKVLLNEASGSHTAHQDAGPFRPASLPFK